jgi:hypothetical protein
LLHRSGRGRSVVIADEDEIDLAAVDTTLSVDLLEIRGFSLSDFDIGRGWPAAGSARVISPLRRVIARIAIGLAGTLNFTAAFSIAAASSGAFRVCR